MTQIWILSCVEELEPKCLGTSVLTCIGHFTFHISHGRYKYLLSKHDNKMDWHKSYWVELIWVYNFFFPPDKLIRYYFAFLLFWYEITNFFFLFFLFFFLLLLLFSFYCNEQAEVCKRNHFRDFYYDKQGAIDREIFDEICQ